MGGGHKNASLAPALGTEDQPNRSPLMDRARFHFFDRMRLWFNHHEPEPSASDDSSENVISLSEAFYRNRPTPNPGRA